MGVAFEVWLQSSDSAALFPLSFFFVNVSARRV